MSKEPDRIFAQPLAQVPDFAFNEDVVRVFPDMIKRSVPGYPTIVENLGVLAAQFAQPDSVLYDLGCSLGAVTQALRRQDFAALHRAIAAARRWSLPPNPLQTAATDLLRGLGAAMAVDAAG